MNTSSDRSSPQDRAYGSLVMALLNRGFGREALRLAEGCGARGVTFLQGNGNLLHFQDPRPSEVADVAKEVLLVVCPYETATEIMKTFHSLLGLQTPAHGIFYEFPVTYAAGLARNPYAYPGEREEGISGV